MYEEQFLVSLGCPLEDAVTLCHSMRRDGSLDRFMEEVNRGCGCGCGCKEPCPDCPRRNK